MHLLGTFYLTTPIKHFLLLFLYQNQVTILLLVSIHCSSLSVLKIVYFGLFYLAAVRYGHNSINLLAFHNLLHKHLSVVFPVKNPY